MVEWGEISGLQSPSGDLRYLINAEVLNDFESTNTINSSLLEPMQQYRLREPLDMPPLEDSPQFLEVTEQQVY